MSTISGTVFIIPYLPLGSLTGLFMDITPFTGRLTIWQKKVESEDELKELFGPTTQITNTRSGCTVCMFEASEENGMVMDDDKPGYYQLDDQAPSLAFIPTSYEGKPLIATMMNSDLWSARLDSSIDTVKEAFADLSDTFVGRLLLPEYKPTEEDMENMTAFIQTFGTELEPPSPPSDKEENEEDEDGEADEEEDGEADEEEDDEEDDDEYTPKSPGGTPPDSPRPRKRLASLVFP